MGLFELIILSVALGSDAFSVAVCIGLTGATGAERLRLATGFGGFQFLMPIVGIIIGQRLGHVFGDVAACVGGGILVCMGAIIVLRTVRSGFTCPPFNHDSVLSLMIASIGVSVDALVVGFGIGLFSAKAVLTTCSVIGLTAFAMTSIGFEIGDRIGRLVQNRSAVLGGLILIAIGARIIVQA
ncbi:MAG: manganese efflux pump [Armatimonadota bacterium]|nr:manganese efflux pump [Armatimonadota bacterium]